MKRSEINALLKKNISLLKKMKVKLPPFAFWKPREWKTRGAECREIVERNLGWDITDFGSGTFDKVGLFLFTVRNGTLANFKRQQGKTYAEKIMIIEEEQVTPTHFHFQKTEDIINRGSGELMIQVWNSTADERLADTEVNIEKDGVRMLLKAGDIVTLTPGESVCLEQRVYHKFWGRQGAGTVLAGEVSVVNDDHTDNRFLEAVGRFPDIEEDVPPKYLLCIDYARYYHGIH